MSKTTTHILVIRLSAMGDVAMTVPVLKVFTEQYPEVRLTVLTRQFFKPFFRDLKNVEVCIVDVKGKHKGVLGLYKLARELNKTHEFYAVADLHNVLRSKILKRFIRGERLATIDKGRSEKKALVSGNLFKQLKTTHERYADVFKALGFPLDISNPTFSKAVALDSKTNQFLASKTKKSIGIAPFAAHQGKMYPLDLMEEVIIILSKDYNIVLFGGGQSEIDILERIEAKSSSINSVAGKLTLNEELDLISNLDVMLSMDSGNAHIAAMLGVKVVTVWGVTHPYAGFAPFNQPEDFAILSDRNKFPLIPTSIYGNKHPEAYKEASRSIRVETIVEKVKRIVKA